MTIAMPRRTRQYLAVCLLGSTLAVAATPAVANDPHPFKELLETSLKDKKGLIFYVKGQTIPGAVTRMIGESAVEVKNREYGRIVIRLDRVDAVASN